MLASKTAQYFLRGKLNHMQILGKKSLAVAEPRPTEMGSALCVECVSIYKNGLTFAQATNTKPRKLNLQNSAHSLKTYSNV